MVYVDVCLSVMAFLQVLAEFHNKALQFVKCRAQNAALARPPAPGRYLLRVCECPETWLETADGKCGVVEMNSEVRTVHWVERLGTIWRF